MGISTYDHLIAQVGLRNAAWQRIYDEVGATTTNLIGTTLGVQRLGTTTVLPTLPSGVTGYIPTSLSLMQSTGTSGVSLIGSIINLGSIDISGASGTFTDGVAMPTVTELGVSRVMSSVIIAEVTTALNATPGSITVTYTDQDGVSSSTAALPLAASAAVRSCAFITLAAGDTGCRDITAVSRSGGTTPTGVVKFWGIVPIALINPSPAGPGGNTFENLITHGFNWVKLGAAARVEGFFFSATAAKTIDGDIYFVGDN